MTHCELVLAALSDGEWHSTSALYRECGPMILHSRISDLRERGKTAGYTILHRHAGGVGADAHEYLYLPTDTTTPTLHRMTITQLEAGVAEFADEGLADAPSRITADESTAAVVAEERQLELVEPDGYRYLGGGLHGSCSR